MNRGNSQCHTWFDFFLPQKVSALQATFQWKGPSVSLSEWVFPFLLGNKPLKRCGRKLPTEYRIFFFLEINMVS